MRLTYPTLLLLATACGSARGASADAGAPDACHGLCSSQTVVDMPAQANRDVDLLFVIDDSPGAFANQMALNQAIPRFLDVLGRVEGGLPNLHIGVATTNVGIGPNAWIGCGGDGDDGALQLPRSPACSPPSDHYIVDVLQPDGSRSTNYPTDLTMELGCLVFQLEDGCAFEQTLESMKRALDGHRPENAGFLRNGQGSDPDALLSVVFLTNEDDCSALDDAIFDQANTALGPYGSFRCTEYGVKCDGQTLPRAAGTYSACEPMPAEQAQYIQHPDPYVDFLKNVKSDPAKIFVGAIIGDPTPVSVSIDPTDGRPLLDCSCGCGTPQEADPAVRLAYFADQFGDHSATATVCNADLDDAVARVAEGIRAMIGYPCLAGDISDPSTCTAYEVTETGETEIPPCSAGGATCFDLVEDQSMCGDTASHLAVHVTRASTPAPGARVVVRCQVTAP